MILFLALLILLVALFGAPLFAVIAAAAFLIIGAHPEEYVFRDMAQSLPIELVGKLADSPLFIALPLFTFAGYLLAESKAPARLVALSRALLGWLPGGIPLVAVAACAFFTAFTGATGVTIIALGGFLYPILREGRYSEKFSLGLLTTCGSLGLLFPPSLPILLYGYIAEVDIDRLFRAGVLPGLLLMGVLVGWSIFREGRSGARVPFAAAEAVRAVRAAAWELPIPLIILVGIYGGYLIASEAAALTALYVLVVEVAVYRDLRVRDLPSIVRRSMVLMGAVLIILAAALGFTNLLVDQNVPQQILGFMLRHISDRYTFLFVLNLFLLVVGCLMDIFSAILVVVPLIRPIAGHFGVQPEHLAIIFLTNLEIGYITPPVGLNLFLASLRFERRVVDLYRATLPFLLLLLAALAVITYVPALSTCLLPAVK
ncbi:MAG: TRAP transporter large permease subunit [Planctomycetes bacterium]|nr:TRAP transporter large permease subunit [Planctomycetota bacterium]